tara:strand:+ start:605 stop:1192 length:588 start_codon:yes stop_codon:yes gene_type:complete
MNELIQIIKILEPEEVQEINSYVDTLDFDTNTVFDGKDGTKVSDIRTSTGVGLDNLNMVTQKLHSAINRGLDEYKRRVVNIHNIFSYYPVPGGNYTKSWREAIQVLQYEKTQEYQYHHDVCNEREREEYHRQISVIVYLTEDFKGGGTAFPHATYRPRAGYGLIFPSNWCYPHAGEPVDSGIKRVAVTWYYVEQT